MITLLFIAVVGFLIYFCFKDSNSSNTYTSFRMGSDSGNATNSTTDDDIFAKMVLMAKVSLDLSNGGDVGIFTFMVDGNDIVFIANGCNELWCYRNKPSFPDDALLNRLCNGCTSFELERFLKFMNSVQIEADSYSFKI